MERMVRIKDMTKVDTKEVEKDNSSKNKMNNGGRMVVEVKAKTKDEVGRIK